MRIICLVVCVALWGSVYGQDKNCLKEFKTGKFAYEGRYGQDVEIIRTEGQQIELTNKGQSKQVLDVNWTTESTYVLTLREVVNRKPCLKIGDWIKVQIVECKDKRYLVKYVSERCGKGESVLIKLNN